MVRHEVATEEPRTKQVKTARLPPSRRKACLQWLGWAGEGRPSPLCPAVIRIRPLKVSVDCGLPAVTFLEEVLPGERVWEARAVPGADAALTPPRTRFGEVSLTQKR
jgi:hypothetical protein